MYLCNNLNANLTDSESASMAYLKYFSKILYVNIG